MRDCPKCGAPVDGSWCEACGEGKPSTLPAVVRDPLYLCCCDVDRNGNRCAKPGAFSESTKGSDRWFCEQHFPLFRVRWGPRTAPPPGWANTVKRPSMPLIGELTEDIAERAAIQAVDA